MNDRREGRYRAEPEQDADARRMAERLFVARPAPGTLAPVLTDALPSRAVGYQFWQHDLDREQWRNLVKALRLAGVTDGEAFGTVFGEGFWRFPLLDDVWPYASLAARGWSGVFQNAIYSVHGAWAIAVADEEFAIAAGSPEFIAALRETMPEFSETAVEAFVAYWRDEVADSPDSLPCTWVLQVLEHTYGSEAHGWLALFRGNDG